MSNEPTLLRQDHRRPSLQQTKPEIALEVAAQLERQHIGRRALREIETRAKRSAAVGQDLDIDTAREMAASDAHAFRSIEDRGLQERAAVVIAKSTRDYREYKEGLDKANPGTAEKVYALDAAHDQKVMAKEEHKAADFTAITQGNLARASAWSPEEAASHAQHDAAEFHRESNKNEQYSKVNDLALIADANPHYREALEQAAPEVVKKIDMRGEAARQIDLDRVAAARAPDTA